jgi:hypothetical protein
MLYTVHVLGGVEELQEQQGQEGAAHAATAATKALRKGCKACSSADKRGTLQHSQPLSQENPVQPGTSLGLAGCLARGPPCCPECAAPPHLHTHPPIHLKVPVE